MRPIFVLLGCCFVGTASAQDLDVKVTFLEFHKAELLQPATMSLRVEIVNPSAEPRWLVTQLLLRTALPESGRFAVGEGKDFPLHCLKFTGAKGHAMLVHFPGTPSFDALLLPGGVKIVFEKIRIDAHDARELPMWQATSLLADGKTPLEKWLPLGVASTQVTLTEKANVTHPLEDVKPDDLPKAAVKFFEAKIERKWAVPVVGYDHPPVHYQPGVRADRKKEKGVDVWQPYLTFESVQKVKVEDLAFSPDSGRLVVSLQSLKVAGLDLKTGKEIVYDAERQGFCRFLAFAPNGQLWVRQIQGIKDRSARGFLNLTTGERMPLRAIEKSGLNWIKDGVLSPDHKLLAMSDGQRVLLWDLTKDVEAGQLGRVKEPHDHALDTLTFSADGKYLTGVYQGPKVDWTAVWDLTSRKTVIEVPHLRPSLQWSVLSPDNKKLAAASKQTTAPLLWDMTKTKEIAETPLRQLDQHVKGVTLYQPLKAPNFSTTHALRFSPDGRYLAALLYNVTDLNAQQELAIWDTQSGKTLGLITELEASARSLAFSADGRFLATGDSQGRVKIWERVEPKE